MKILRFEVAPIADCIFMQVQTVKENLPPYIQVVDNFEFTEQ
jgi:hypothetical protein